ncbi:acyltransferase [Mucilaginibacter glaciei]|uniref:Acyltransferase family protein n=1 Tax=Mucilaginibacter glaciei TaxID=2772109 RepID=A0A926NVK0_9SPHI|nr:acyltransferase family protein [Mucilaginibacter glaciei]MBD1395362.1 acyltransferase family protein [Mucilaginibacter glaciei]
MKFSEAIIQDKTQNIAWISNLRLIAMFAVVVLHTASPLLMNYKGVSPGEWMVADVYNAITRFAVPVFVMITGALLLNREYELSDFLKKRVGRLLIPFLFWSLVYIVYQWYEEIIYFNGDAWENIKLVLHQLKTGTSYHLWYVYLLFGLYLIIPILSKFVRNATEKELLYFLAVWFITVVIGKPYLTRFATAIDLSYFSGYIGYLVLGYYLAYKDFKLPFLAFPALILFAAMVVLIACGTYYLQVKDYGLSTFFYEPIGPFVVILASGAFLAAKNLTVKLSEKTNIVIQNASKCTLGIYFSHALILNVLEINEISYKVYNPWLSIPAVASGCFLISWLLIWGLSKIPVVKHIVG